MDEFRYNKKLKVLARKLRRNQSDAEKLLWSKLPARQMCCVKFRRQFPLGKYILDFCCLSKKLAVELDGGQHCDPDVVEYDKLRTKEINRFGIRIIRFSNYDVRTNIEGVILEIKKVIQTSP